MRYCLLVVFLWPLTGLAGDVLSDVPEHPDPGTKYLFYLHGQIVEDVGLRPTHPRWGLYDYPAVLDALAIDGVTVISVRRPKGTDHDDYAAMTKRQVEALISAGVKSSDITVAGFSAGGMIVIRTSDKSRDLGVSYIIMASCSDWLDDATELSLNGRVLSIFEKSDGPQSCQRIADRAPGPTSFDELEIDTGLEHGAFYLPRDEWVEPVLDWVRSY